MSKLIEDTLRDTVEALRDQLQVLIGERDRLKKQLASLQIDKCDQDIQEFKKTRYWAARDENGDVCLYDKEPEKDLKVWQPVDWDTVIWEAPKDTFQHIKWTDERATEVWL